MISLRPISEDDLKFINDIRNDLTTRSQLENTEIISLEETAKWFKEKSPAWFIINWGADRVGYIRTSHNTGNSICIGCDISPLQRGKGYAKAAYQCLIQLYKNDYSVIWLDVYRDNTIAYNLYKKLGFIEVGSARRLVNNREYVTMVYSRKSE